MSWLDIVILVVVASGAFLGLAIGIIKAALSLIGLIAGIILAGRYYVALSERLAFVRPSGVAEVLAFAVIIIGVMLIASLLARLLKWVTSAVMLGWVNHFGGAVFGLALGAILCSALLAIWGKFFDVAGIISQSSLAVILLDRFPAVLALLPDEFDMIRSFFQ